jgi:hypothetical protein
MWNKFGREKIKGIAYSWSWLYGEQVKEFQMWVTSSLPSQHNKALSLYPIFEKKQYETTNSKGENRLNKTKEHPNNEKRANMRNESKVLKEILGEIKETNRLIAEMNQSFQQLMKRMIPEKHSSETIQKGGPIAEITVRTPEKLEEWRRLFENRGMRVEYYEPVRTDGEEYFAKLWGYLDGFLSQENPS